MLKAWIDELLVLGANPKVKDCVYAVWKRYLSRLGLAFVPKGKETGLSIFPTSRDVQVKLFNRKRVLNHLEIRRRLRKIEGKNEKKKKSDSSDEDEATKVKRRRKKKRDFFRTLVSESSVGNNNSKLR